MNDLVNRLRGNNVIETECELIFKDEVDKIAIFLTKLGDDNIGIADAVTALLAAHDDLGESYNELLNNIKDGVEYVPPVDEKAVDDMKAKIAQALAERFSKKKENELPDFGAKFWELSDYAKDRFKDCFMNPAFDGVRYGHRSYEPNLEVRNEVFLSN